MKIVYKASVVRNARTSSVFRAAILVLGVILLASGCATFPGHKIPDTPRISLASRQQTLHHIVGYSVRGTDFMGGDSDNLNCLSFYMYNCYGDGTYEASWVGIPFPTLQSYTNLPLERAIEKITGRRILPATFNGNSLTLHAGKTYRGELPPPGGMQEATVTLLSRTISRFTFGGYVASAIAGVELANSDNLDNGNIHRKEIAECAALVSSGQGEVPLIPTPEIRKAIPSVRQQIAKSARYRNIPEPPSWKNWDRVCSGLQPTNAVVADIEVYGKLRYGLSLAIANAVVSGITFTLIPTVVPGDFTMTLRLRSLDGTKVWEQTAEESQTVAVGIPIVFWSFSKEHNLFSGPRRSLSNQCRYLLKQVP
jgi:hypothetical protein